MIPQKMGNCEVCPSENVEVKFFHTMWMCIPCYEKEIALTSQNNTPEAQTARVLAVNAPLQILQQAREIDSSIQVRTDLFNAATTAIVDLKKAIDDNVEITNKPYALATELKNRFEHFRNVVFELNEKIAEAGNQQRAIQVYLNNLANQLRTEEREQLKIADINYKPQAVKSPTVKKLTTTGTSGKKATNADIKKAAQELGIAEFTLKSFVVMTGGDLQTAVDKIKKSMAAAKQV